MPFRPKQFRPATYRPPAKKIADRYYSTPSWKTLREACLRRDGHRCVVPGCSNAAIVADHVVARAQGGADALHNLRSLCRLHDNQSRERSDGSRNNELGNDMLPWLVAQKRTAK